MLGRGRWGRGALGQAVAVVSYCLLTYLSLTVHRAYRSQEAPAPDWAARVARVRAVCSSASSSGLLPPPPQLTKSGDSSPLKNHFTKIHRKQILSPVVRVKELGFDWCLVPKVASSSISRAILPFLPPRPSTSKATLYPHIQQEVWERAGRLEWEEHAAAPLPALLLTRHPLARIASAYRNKLEDRHQSHDGEYFYNTYSRQVIKHSRGEWLPSSPEPSFPEFLSWLLVEPVDKWDEHWLPVSLRCRVCQLPFRYILRYEDLEEEWPQLLDSLEVTSLQKEALQLPWDNRGVGGGLKPYYRNVSEATMDQLVSKVQEDLTMFGYTMEDDF